MVDPVVVAIDSVSTTMSLALPALLWAALFLLAWEHGRFAESVGLDRRAFWLLLPGALLSSYALVPIAPIANDWLTISFGGAIFPLLVGALAIRRYAPPAARTLAGFLAPLAVETAAMLLIVVPSSAGAVAALGRSLGIGGNGAAILLVTVVGALACVAVGVTRLSSPDPSAVRSAFLFLIANGVLLLTFAGSSAIPNVGIVESFPYYLLAPVVAGIAAGMYAPRIFPGEEGFALPVALLTGSVGVLVGADVLREPPLYGHGAPGLYAIGGAGVLDLVYLSGLLAVGTAYLVHLAYERPWTPVGPPLPALAESPERRLREAFRAGVAGDLPNALAGSVGAARAAALQVRRLFGAGTAPADRPWDGLPVPGWIVSDHANLESAARSGTADPREGYRAWLTARWLVLAGRELGLRRFATVGERTVAFLVDLAAVSLPSFAVFAVIAQRTPGGYVAVADSVPFNAAIVGAIAAGILYLALAEAYLGTTVGKAVVRIGVRDRSLGRPDGLSALVRNLPLAPVLSLVAIGGAIALAVAVKGAAGGTASLLGLPVPGGLFAGLGILAFVAGGVALLGSFGVLAIALTTERQRVGDLWAGTWVVRDGPGPGAATPRPAPEPGPTPPGPGADRSG